MLRFASTLLAYLNALLADRNRLAIENAMLRMQVEALAKNSKRPTLTDGDRIFWILASSFFANWREHLVIVKPETVIAWHRKRFAYYWRRKSKRKGGGRPGIMREIIELIRRMSKVNPLWGSPRIRDELRMVGHRVAKSTVEKYMLLYKDPGRGRQRWRTFLANHMDTAAACDFFTVPSLTFQTLYVFIVIAHGRRRIVRIAVTMHPSSQWAARQIIEAFLDGEEPSHLHHDCDRTCGTAFHRTLKALGIESIPSAPASPWQNPFAERVIGTLRRECTDHLIPLSERHLEQRLTAFADEYYNDARCHSSLDGDAPIHREVQRTGKLAARPVLNSLHHVYSRRAA